MRIQTFTIVAGSEACNASCPYCISRMTPGYELGTALPSVNWRNFRIGCRFAKDSGVSTVLLTGKGEPTLFPEQLTAFLKELQPLQFPFVEMQTNGIALAAAHPVSESKLREWYALGLSLIALSVVHWRPERNKEIYRRDSATAYYDLAELISRLHALKFSVRLSCMMLKGFVDDAASAEKLIDFAREQKVEQLTIRSITQPEASADSGVSEFVSAHALAPAAVQALRQYFDTRAVRLMELAHGAIVYDHRGQNVCLNNCLTLDPRSERMRQLIFFPDGHLRYDWQYPGAILL